MTSRPGTAEWSLLLALTVMWGSAFMLTKVAVATLPHTLVVGGRLAVAALALALVALMAVRGVPRGRRLWVYFGLIALFGQALPFTLISWGQRYMDSGLAGILMAVMPLFTLTLAHFTIPGERFTPRRGLGFTLGFAGVVVLTGPAAVLKLSAGSGQLLPMMAVLGGAACYAIASILARLRPPSDPVSSALATTLIAAAVMVPFAVGHGPVGALRHADTPALAAVTLLGLFSTALAGVVYFRLIGRAGPAFVSQLNYLIPLWAVALGISFLGETPEPNHFYALGLILAGITLAQRDTRAAVRDRAAPEPAAVALTAREDRS